MRHRGPDGNGRYVAERNGRHVCLLHSRLSIIDLDHRADQPFREGTQVTVFNGEIYNYLEERTRLVAAGEGFRTESDTEVLAKKIRREGANGLDSCEGMWAFATYDEVTGELMLSRDRFGEKPMYLANFDGGLYFGSEIKFIRALSGRRLEIDTDHVRRYLVNGYKSLYKKSNSFFSGIRELGAGSVLNVSPDGAEAVASYWKPRVTQRQSMTFDDAVVRVREALIEAVKIRLRADVPLAFCMSGGVDSNALISLAKRKFDYDVHGFTIVNTDARYEEQDIVNDSVKELGIRHTSVALSNADFLPQLRKLVCAHDAPVYTITYFVHWQLMQAVADHGYKISISGTGADELMTGYYDHHLFFLSEPSVMQSDVYAPARAAWEAQIKPLVRNPFLSDPARFQQNSAFRDHIYLDAAEFSASLNAPWAEEFEETRYVGDNLRNRMLNELFHETVPAILHEDDLNTMYYSIENRSPFLDRRLFEAVAEIPTRFLMRDGYAKVLLREAVRGIAPDAVVNSRRKVGFNAPIHDLLDVSNPNIREEILDDGTIFDIVNRTEIERWLSKEELTNSESKFLFSFISARMFMESI